MLQSFGNAEPNPLAQMLDKPEMLDMMHETFISSCDNPGAKAHLQALTTEQRREHVKTFLNENMGDLWNSYNGSMADMSPANLATSQAKELCGSENGKEAEEELRQNRRLALPQAALEAFGVSNATDLQWHVNPTAFHAAPPYFKAGEGADVWHLCKHAVPAAA